MNKVFISGMVMGTPALHTGTDGTQHLTLTLGVRHKTRAGEIRRESYRVSAWGNVAEWGSKSLTTGQIVGVQGYLTQRQVKTDGICAVAVEVAAEEFLVMRLPRVETEEREDAEEEAAS